MIQSNSIRKPHSIRSATIAVNSRRNPFHVTPIALAFLEMNVENGIFPMFYGSCDS